MLRSGATSLLPNALWQPWRSQGTHEARKTFRLSLLIRHGGEPYGSV